MSLTDRSQKRRFALVIAGLPEVYYSHSSEGLTSVPAIGNALSTTPGATLRTFKEAIVNVTDYGANLDPLGGVASYTPITVSLVIDRNGGDSDPGVILSRIGPRASGASHSFLVDGINHSDATPITVELDRDVSAVYSSGDYAHIGAETFLVSGTTSGANPTITFSDRGLADTPIQDHLISLGGTNSPEMTDQICYWRGRRASIWVSPGRSDGSYGGWVELMRGFLDSTPQIEDGLAVTLEVVPLTALIDQGLTGEISRQTTLLQGYHRFEAGVGNIVEYAQGLHAPSPTSQPNLMGVGIGSWNQHGGASLPTSEIYTTGVHQHEEIFDITLTTADGARYDNHPRIGDLGLENKGGQIERFQIVAYRIDAGLNVGYDINPDPGPLTDFHNDQHGYIIPTQEIKRYEQAEGLIRWPEEFITGFNAAAPSGRTGRDGGFFSVRLVEEGGRIQLRLLPFADTRLRTHIMFWTHPAALFNEGVRNLRYWSANGPQRPVSEVTGRELMVLPIDWSPPARREYPLLPPHENARRDATLYRRAWEQDEQKLQAYNLRDYALGFFQPGEGRILVTDQLPGVPTAAGTSTFAVSITSYDRRTDQEITQTAKITHQVAEVYGTTTVGYALILANEPPNRQPQDLKPIVDWASRGDEGRAKIALANLVDAAPPGEIILQLLESGGGNQINGDYDVSAIGLNLPSSAIDENSFLALSDASRLANMTLALSGDDVEILDVVEGILKALGAAIVLRRSGTDNERLKLTCVPVGMEQASRVRQTIAAGDWLVDPPPSWGTRDASVNQIVFKYDWNDAEKKFRGEVTVNNERAIMAYSQERQSTDLELYGVDPASIGQNTSDLYSTIRPMFTRIFRLASDPVRVWRGSVGFDQGHLLEVGAMVEVSSPHFKGYGDSYGVTDGLALVQSVRQSLTGEGVDVELLHYGLGAAGWNASAEVVAVVSATVLEFDPNTYTRGRDAAGELTTDLALFEEGDRVQYIPPGDEDNPTTLKIDSVDTATNRITFTAAHGVASAVGHIEPTTYDTAPARHQIRAYLADSSGTIGASSDDGDKYL